MIFNASNHVPCISLNTQKVKKSTFFKKRFELQIIKKIMVRIPSPGSLDFSINNCGNKKMNEI